MFSTVWKDREYDVWAGRLFSVDVGTGRDPSLLLESSSIVLDDKDWNMGIRLNSTLQYAGLAEKVKVWYYPQDFGITIEQLKQQFEEERNADPNATGYWLTTNSGVRHNKGCRWYTQSKGRYCNANEGKPCGQCGG